MDNNKERWADESDSRKKTKRNSIRNADNTGHRDKIEQKSWKQIQKLERKEVPVLR